MSIEPDNEAVKHHPERVKNSVTEGMPTIASTLAVEKKTNPFLRVFDPKLQRALQLSDTDPVTVPTYIR
ncbi:MAG: hydroxyacylglutathione hydrolase C-terminal domain-containing protein [Chlamydiota bacterium]